MSDGRSDHKPATRQVLIDVALHLFGTNGYEATSTQQIAAGAGVSPRTFFRYFETKDQVLFFGGDAFNQHVVRDLPSQPSALDDLAALEATIMSLLPLVEPLKARIRAYFAAVDGSAVLLGQHALATGQHDAAVAAALARRRRLVRPDQRCHVAARLGSLATERAYRTWVATKRPLSSAVQQSFQSVRDVARGSGQPSAPASR